MFAFHVDINECMEGNDSCIQNCTNTDGSYMCNCSSGYRLNNDGYSCNGIAPVLSLVNYYSCILLFNLQRCQ